MASKYNTYPKNQDITDSELSRLSRNIPCGDKTFQQQFVIEGLGLSASVFKRTMYDTKNSVQVKRTFLLMVLNL